MTTLVGVLTHHALWDEPGRVLTRAICGAVIHRRDSVALPTCPECQRLLAARDREEAP